MTTVQTKFMRIKLALFSRVMVPSMSNCCALNAQVVIRNSYYLLHLNRKLAIMGWYCL